MGEVTIDSIQIEIESSSTNAAKGIDALAGSLEKLKKHGSFKTVSNNLNNLSTALKNLPNVHSASNSLRTLANSIEKLKGVGSVSSLTNSLTKLPTALKSLSNINLEKVAPQVQKIADAVAPLSNIKAGGLNTMVNSIKKLGEVTESLDDETIERFAKKVELLNSKLAPLSEKMTSIKAGFNAINSSARKAADGIEDFGDGINVGALNMSSFIEIVRTAIDTISNIVTAFKKITEQAIEWDGISARFGRGFGSQAQETYAWIQRLNEEMGINIQEFMKYSSVYSTMLTGFGVASEDAGKMALGYMELTYDIWAGYNDVYGSLEETAEAVKSAIAGEVEPVRRAGFTIVESTLKQTAANHGLEISLENATEAQKSYLRYLTLMDQAHAQGLVGTYAKELNTAEGMMRTFAQQMKSLAQAFGSLFLPILVRVMPWLQAFVELLTEGVYWLANLLGIEIQDIGDSWNNFNSGAQQGEKNTQKLNEEIEKSQEEMEKLKNATLGIDELNIISPTSNTGANDGAGNGNGSGSNSDIFGDIDSLWDETIFDEIQSDVDKIKEKLKDWLPTIAGVATALAGLRLIKLLDDIKLVEATKFFSLITGKSKDFFGWLSAFTSLAKEGGILAALAAAFPKVSSAIATFTGNLGAFFALAKEGGIISALSAAFPKLSTAISGIGTAIGGISATTIGLIAAAILLVGSAIYFVVENWDELKQAVKDFFAENIVPKLEEIKKHFDKMKEALEPLKPVFEWLGTAFEWLKGVFADFGQILLVFIESLGYVVTGLLGGVLAGAFNAIVGVIEGAIQMISGAVQMIRGYVDLLVGIFTMDGAKIEEAWGKIWSGAKDIYLGFYDVTIGVVVEFVKGIISWFTELWDVLVGHSIVPDTINAIVDWFKSLPGKIFDTVANFVKGIIDKFANLGTEIKEKFSSAWETVKEWWNNKDELSTYIPSIGDIKQKLSDAWTTAKNWWDKTKEKLSTYTPSIGAIWEKLKSAWETAKKWWNNNKEALKTYTPSIGKIWEKLKTAWGTAKTWWKENRGSLSTYTPSIGKIWEKLKSAWNTAKTWWKENRGSLSTYTPSIGSIADKLKSAWNSAKTWWKNNVGSLSTKIDIKVPTIKVKWDTVTAFGKSFKYPTGFDLKFAADGGIFDAGSLIWAGERGAEIVANAGGGKTGVMNVQQMQDAVYEGVYAAMMSAMRGNNGGSGSQVIKVYLDGKEITHTVEQHQRERGASIMGNEVYSY